MKSILTKTLVAVLSVALLAFVGFWGALIAAFSGGSLFYAPLILVCTGLLAVFVVLWVYRIVKPKLLRTLFFCFLGLCVLSIGAYEGIEAYKNNIGQVNDQGVNLMLYRPFEEDTLAVKLEEEPTLKLEGDLPRLDGATALYPLYAAFVQAVYPEDEYDVYAFKEQDDQPEVVCTTTGSAYDRLMHGETDIIFVARPSQQQLDEAKSLGVEFKLTPIGKEAFVFFVNGKNPVDGLSTEQIQEIYAGNITNWQEVGGKDAQIRAFQRPQNSGSQTMLQKVMEGKTLMTPPRENVAGGMGEIIDQTASYRNYKNAIGYSFLFFATEMVQNNQIKLLSVDGVPPERSTIASGEYPLTAELYAITTGSDNPNIERFIEWILSPQGQYLVEKTGYTAINK